MSPVLPLQIQLPQASEVNGDNTQAGPSSRRDARTFPADAEGREAATLPLQSQASSLAASDNINAEAGPSSPRHVETSSNPHSLPSTSTPGMIASSSSPSKNRSCRSPQKSSQPASTSTRPPRDYKREKERRRERDQARQLQREKEKNSLPQRVRRSGQLGGQSKLVEDMIVECFERVCK
jgi:hypothetical protein